MDYPKTIDKKTEEVFKQMKTLEDTTEITLYKKAMQNQLLINSFLRVIQESSIDCSIWQKNVKNHAVKLRCRICKPTDKPLFIEDLDKDIHSPNACELWQEEKIQAKSIEMDGVEYMYHIDKDGQIHIFEFNDKLNGYEEIYIEHPAYEALYKKLKKI
jgi:hypothetical protein